MEINAVETLYACMAYFNLKSSRPVKREGSYKLRIRAQGEI